MKFRYSCLSFVFAVFAFFNVPTNHAMNSASISLRNHICTGPLMGVYTDVVLEAPFTADVPDGTDVITVYFFNDYSIASAVQFYYDDSYTYPHTGDFASSFRWDASRIDVLVVDSTEAWGEVITDYEAVRAENVLAQITIMVADICPELIGRRPPASDNSSETGVVMPPDNRINWQFGELNAILYHGTDGEGNPALNIYCYDGQNSWLGFSVHAANMNEAPIQAQGCNATFYILESGELQINITSDEGKLYEIICADLACESPTLRYFDPTE